MWKEEYRNLKAIIRFFRDRVFPLFEEEKLLFKRDPDWAQGVLKALKTMGISLIPSIGPALIAVREAINQEKVSKRIELIEKIVSLKSAELREISEATKFDLYTLLTIQNTLIRVQNDYNYKGKTFIEVIDQLTMMNQTLKSIYAIQQKTYNLCFNYFYENKKNVPTFVPSTDKEVFKFQPQARREGKLRRLRKNSQGEIEQ